MQKVPQIVRDRLKATPPAVNHPDADALNAFAERLLSESERAVVYEHLVRCGDCRDIVALALPEPDASHAVTVPARSGWLTWPALRWGFAAAGIIVIASFGVLEYQHSRSAMTVTKRSGQGSITAQVQSPPSSVTTPTRELQKTLDASQPSADARPAGAPAGLPEPKRFFRVAPPAAQAPRSEAVAGSAIGGAIAFGPHMPTQQQQQTAANPLQSLPPSAPQMKQQAAGASGNLKVSASEAVNIQAAAGAIQTRQDEARAQNQPAPSTPAEPLFDKDASAQVEKVDKAKPALNGRNLTQLVAFAPRWAINSAGGLQRSFDQGQTWQDVDVNTGAKLSAGATSLKAGTAARAKEYYADKKTLKEPAPVFRVVAVTGADVWAGGSQGVLYHSIDSGNQWVQVVPASAGTTLTGDIVALAFSDTQQGTITTSTGETWTTNDQGQTWQKQ